MVERGKHNEPYKPKDEKRRDEFLTRSLLRHGSDVHAALNELSVVHEKIDAQRLRGHLKHGYEDPRLPIVERACRNEQAREQNCERYQVGQYARTKKFDMDVYLATSLHHLQALLDLTHHCDIVE